MIPALIILAVTIGFGAVLFACHKISERRTPNYTPDDAEAAPAVEEEGCCGMHITCEKDSLATLSTEIIYYDDEELDAYRGIAPDGYSDSQIEEFRDVLLTLLPEDIAGWARSLRLRGIEMPACVKEELLLLVSEERERKNMK